MFKHALNTIIDKYLTSIFPLLLTMLEISNKIPNIHYVTNLECSRSTVTIMSPFLSGVIPCTLPDTSG